MYVKVPCKAVKHELKQVEICGYFIYMNIWCL